MNTPNHPSASEQLFKALENRLWSEVENIGGCHCYGYDKLSDSELAAFAKGAENTLVCLLESLQNNYPEDQPRKGRLFETDPGRWAHQLRAAVGEQLRRRHPNDRQCEGRKLNQWLCAIRDLRIRMIDNYNDDPVFGFYMKTQKEIDRWERSQTDDSVFETLQLIRRELHALYALKDQLVFDHDWTKEKFRRRHEKMATAQKEAA